ncbi:MAG TPA: alpha/beta hydrolase domain-containing protein [Burkholderiales bacterium]|nr:alpha/beta hydrolase domain-containing protein [Burkholderiales bacterium]
MPVTRVEIEARGPLAGGRSFGASGAYEYLTGVLHFASNPKHPGNATICDLNLAPTNRDGLVEHRAQFHLLKPSDPEPRGRVLIDSINRGNLTAVPTFNSAPRRTDGNPDIDVGNGFLFRNGYSVLSIGVQWDPPESPERMRAWYPEAIENGQRVRGQSFVQWWPNKRVQHQLLSDAGHKPYPTADISDTNAVLTVRDHQDGEPTVIARRRWRFARRGGEGVEPSADHVWLEGGFEPGKVYELTYTALGAPIVGLAFLAYRDAASFLRHGTTAEGNPLAGAIDYAYGYGQSMNGRWLREFLYWGLNRDEAGRIAFDGLLANTGSSRRGEFNIRFGQPSTNILRAPGNTYPFAYEATPDAALDDNRGLLDRSRADGSMPKFIATNSGMEYWWSGASLGHTTVDGRRDIEPPQDVRTYYLSGAQHGPGALPLSNRNPDGFLAKQPLNTLDYRPAMRAALTALDLWVREGVVAPPSRVPRIADGTAVSRESLKSSYTRIPGSAWLSHLPMRLRMDFGPHARAGVVRYPPVESGAYPTLVSAMDEDCNEVAGVRLPDVAVPLATYTGWNVRHEEMGQGGLMTSGAPLFGTTLPFMRTRAEREASGDPRKSIDERYASKEDYLARVRAAAQTLVRDRYLLEEDIEPALAVAARKWDAFHGS